MIRLVTGSSKCTYTLHYILLSSLEIFHIPRTGLSSVALPAEFTHAFQKCENSAVRVYAGTPNLRAEVKFLGETFKESNC